MTGSISRDIESMQGKPGAVTVGNMRTPGSDPRWKKWTKPLLLFLQEPRDIHEINAFHNLATNLLAWLENERLVYCRRVGEARYIWCTDFLKLERVPVYIRELDETVPKRRIPFSHNKTKKGAAK